MRVLVWHLDRFRSVVTEKGRSPVCEEPRAREAMAANCALCMIAVEKADEGRVEDVAARFAEFAGEHARTIGVTTFVLLPFSHLFVQLGDPHTALAIFDSIETKLVSAGLDVIRLPFGWFNELELKAKGHPVSRVARQF